MKLTHTNPILSLVNEYLIDSPAPRNLNYFWNFGSLLGLNLVILIISGLTLAMHYTPHISLAFSSVEHIMRDVNNGWLIRYIHANGASFFFIWVYLHIGRGLYYGSYKSPRATLWLIGLAIYFIMMAKILAKMSIFLIRNFSLAFSLPYIRSIKRIGPHNIDILSIFIGSLLGDGHMNKITQQSFRIRFEQGKIHKDYLFWLNKKIKELGYTNSKPIESKGGNYYFYTYSYRSLDYIYKEFYCKNLEKKKRLPSYDFLFEHLTPLALAIWIMDDGAVQKTGLTLETHCFTKEEVLILCRLLKIKYNLLCKINKSGTENQYRIRISEYSLKDLAKLIHPYLHKSMDYKLRKYRF